MTYNFDEIIERKGTSCYKYDLLNKYFKHDDLLPMWVADMDFKTPDFVLNAISERLEHPVLGYSFHPDSQVQSIIEWIKRRHQWDVKPAWIGFTPGVVPALNLAIQTFTDPGDKVIIQTPVYFPFYSAVTDHNRQLALNPLKLINGRYQMDFEQLESLIDKDTKMLVLCSPHNPTGNVWHKNELDTLAQICIKHNLLLISDEIHADIVYSGHKHIPTATISDEISDRTITLMAPSKTFNFAGLATSYFICTNPKLYKKMDTAVGSLHLTMGNIFGNIALEAAYTFGNSWLQQLLAYLEGNIRFAEKFINKHMPMLNIVQPEATFLLWIDFRNCGIDDRTVRDLLVRKAGVALSNGVIFGRDGEGFQRINIGCSQSILEQGLTQISTIFSE